VALFPKPKVKLSSTRDVVAHHSPHIGGATLDLGAGNSKYRSEIRRRSTSYIALDIGGGRYIDVVGEIHALPFAEEVFDTVICTQVLEHVTEPWEAVAEMSRVLRPGGKCIITAPFLVPFHGDPGDYYRFTRDGMRYLCYRTGLEVLEVGEYGGGFMVLAEMIRFALNNPYERYRPLSVCGIWLHRILSKLDRLPRGTVYANVYVVGRKPP
jgi:SAM-dependent methyltransferase